MPSPRRLLLAASCAALLVTSLSLTACATAPTATPPAAEAASEQSPAAAEAAPADAPGLHVSSVKPTGTEVGVITTSKGVIKVEFYPKDAPNTVASFIELADRKFYDGTKFHRVVNEPGGLQIIQGGDPLSRTDDPAVGTGGPGWNQKAEFNSRKHLEGSVAMARSQDPDSAGSQFYVCLAPAAFLDGQYTVFGQVVSGMDVAKKITQGDVVTSVRIEPGK